MISQTDLIRFLQALEDMQLFTLCCDFDKLSLEEQVPTKSEVTTQRFNYTAINLERMRGRLTDNWQRTFMDSLKAPFVNLPPELLLPGEHGIKMGIGFRFTPGQQAFLMRDLTLPPVLDTLRVFSRGLGVTYYTAPLNPIARPVHGVGDILESDRRKVLLEVITNGFGVYGRILVLVILGIGCTTWFSFVPHGTEFGSTFQPIDDYTPFFNNKFMPEGFSKVKFVETENVSQNVETFLEKPPFTALDIPASGFMLKAVGLGVIIATFVALGLPPESLPVAA